VLIKEVEMMNKKVEKLGRAEEILGVEKKAR